MATVSGQGTTYNLPNYHGELFTVAPTDTPFLSMIGGLGGAKTSRATAFEWQAIGRRASAVNNVANEGANAPEATNQSRVPVHNLLEIHHSAIEVSYTREAATGSYSGQNVAAEYDDVILDELALQTQAELESMAVDIEQSFLLGTLHASTSNTDPRKTQGILGAITSNVVDASTLGAGGAASVLNSAVLTAALKKAWDNGAKLPQASTVIMVGSQEKVNLSASYANGYLNAPVRDNTVGGVAIDRVITDFGTFGVALNRWMPQGTAAIVDVSVCYPWFLEIPGKGLLFVEPLARVGAAHRFQLYGEVGLEYGPEQFHAKITGLAATAS